MSSAQIPKENRIESIDLLRGIVMVIMALDHVRDYFHSEAQLYAPEDLAHTDGVLFFTRWITHFCAPVFVFFWPERAQTFFEIPGGPTVRVAYPLIPWIDVMAAGFCFGRVVELPPERRRTLLIRSGAALIAAFFVLRWSVLYGDPSPWAALDTATLTIVSFFNTTKYPPSLLFLLMTLGPAVLALGLLDRVRVRHGSEPNDAAKALPLARSCLL
jgi:uncharacterized membrane protein